MVSLVIISHLNFFSYFPLECVLPIVRSFVSINVKVYYYLFPFTYGKGIVKCYHFNFPLGHFGFMGTTKSLDFLDLVSFSIS
jgi:hypothetical protein